MSTERERALSRFVSETERVKEDLISRVDDLLFSLFLWRLSTLVLAIILAYDLFLK